MAKQREGACPGCSKHCSCENVRCKWEKYVEQGGLLWRYLWIGYRSKNLTEQEMLAVLDDAEKAQLDVLLTKMAGVFDKAPGSDKEKK